ncbi:hypothetical protein [Rahnella sp. ChDrAdgB13]|uniref:hypothetical protein n=1 Tax=Rahnella sp. ChDrAdgB13 TaxID=1850581 RepID=UPI001AD86352|nr:hypothetical protein [Rahnella sp. ChDrAdgB13]
MDLHLEYFGKTLSFRKCPSTGKVFLSVVSGDLFPDIHRDREYGHAAAEQRFEFLFEADSEELKSCLRQLAEITQE